MHNVYWITGLSGAGKTTIGKSLYKKLKSRNDGVVFLDGDILRDVFGNSHGYSVEERKSLAMTYSRMCKMLVEQGLTVICCTISMFHEVRSWNRKNIPNYIEVYLRVSLSVLKERDQKGLYSDIEQGNIFDLVGIDIKMEEPESPDIVIDNDGGFSINECINMITEYKKDDDFQKDKQYWDNYYSKNPPINYPSKFAEDIISYLDKGKSIVDLGCGNGRDSLHFMNNGLYVIGVDGSEAAIYNLKMKHGYNNNINFVCGDFVHSGSIYNKKYSYFYSRFSLHAINDEKQHILLENIYKHLEEGGYLFIEVRSIRDDIYGKGKEVGRNAFIFNEHYRRFIVKEELVSELNKLGFNIILAEEKKGFAPFNNEDPIVLRVIAKKEKSLI